MTFQNLRTICAHVQGLKRTEKDCYGSTGLEMVEELYQAADIYGLSRHPHGRDMGSKPLATLAASRADFPIATAQYPTSLFYRF